MPFHLLRFRMSSSLFNTKPVARFVIRISSSPRDGFKNPNYKMSTFETLGVAPLLFIGLSTCATTSENVNPLFFFSFDL